MTNKERVQLLVAAANRLVKASADFTSVDKLPARQALREAIRAALAGTCAEEFTDELIAQYARHYVPFDSYNFRALTDLVSAATDEDLANVFVYCKTRQMENF